MWFWPDNIAVDICNNYGMLQAHTHITFQMLEKFECRASNHPYIRPFHWD